jgi:hypothetical protein
VGEEAKMTVRKTDAVALFLTLVALAALAMPGARAQDAPVRAGGIHDQITISLPDGWSVYDQTEALSGKASPLGVVVFSAQPVAPPGSTRADAARLAQIDTGEVLSFFVERSAANNGMTCAKLSRGAVYDIATNINRDPAIATAGRRLFGGGLEPHHTDIEVGGCHGVRVALEAHQDDPAKHWKIDVRAVSDGRVLYLFSLRHRGIYYKDNLAVFEKAISTVQFKPAS